MVYNIKEEEETWLRKIKLKHLNPATGWQFTPSSDQAPGRTVTRRKNKTKMPVAVNGGNNEFKVILS